MRDPAAVAVGRNDDDVAKRPQCLREDGDARALDPVVVGNEDAQLRLARA